MNRMQGNHWTRTMVTHLLCWMHLMNGYRYSLSLSLFLSLPRLYFIGMFYLFHQYYNWLLRQMKGKGHSTKKWCQKRGLEEQRFYEMMKLKEQFKTLLVVMNDVIFLQSYCWCFVLNSKCVIQLLLFFVTTFFEIGKYCHI